MRFLPVLALLASAACTAGEDIPSAEVVAADPALPDTILLRIALVVSDVEASKRFYHEGLGFEIGFDGAIDRPAVRDMLQLDDEQTVHFVVLYGADAVDGVDLDGAMIGLLHVANPTLPKMHRPGPGTLATGEGMMALMTSDIAGVFERVQALGATVLYPPTLAPDGSESEFVVYDPDGIRLHVVERHRVRD